MTRHIFSRPIKLIKRKIFLDFDGTLVDSRLRLYQLFQDLMPSSPLTFEQYWEIKRRNVNQRDLLKCIFRLDDYDVSLFQMEWLNQVERPERLRLDQPLPGVTSFLRRMSCSCALFLVSGRQDIDRTRQQIDALGWSKYFVDIMVTRQRQGKAALVSNQVPVSRSDLMVGDTGEDIQAGKELGVKTAAVLTGVATREMLEAYGPDNIFDSVVEIDETSGIADAMCSAV